MQTDDERVANMVAAQIEEAFQTLERLGLRHDIIVSGIALALRRMTEANEMAN